MNNGGERHPLFCRGEILRDLLGHKADDEMTLSPRMHAPAIGPVVRRHVNGSSTIAGENSEIEEKFLRRFRRQERLRSNSAAAQNRETRCIGFCAKRVSEATKLFAWIDVEL